jgi:hypothetical protein
MTTPDPQESLISALAANRQPVAGSCPERTLQARPSPQAGATPRRNRNDMFETIQRVLSPSMHRYLVTDCALSANDVIALPLQRVGDFGLLTSQLDDAGLADLLDRLHALGCLDAAAAPWVGVQP